MSNQNDIEIKRLRSVLDSEYVASLGKPTDFNGHARVIFSLDNFNYTFLEKDNLKETVEFYQGLLKCKLTLRICAGAYIYKDGNFKSEVSFIVKEEYPNEEFRKRLMDYLRNNSKQESVLWISENEQAFLHYLDKAKGKKPLGAWKTVTKDIAHKSVAYTNIGDLWFVAELPESQKLDHEVLECNPILLDHPLREQLDKELPFCNKVLKPNSIMWCANSSAFLNDESGEIVAVTAGLWIDPSDSIVFNLNLNYGWLKEATLEAYQLLNKIQFHMPWSARFILHCRMCLVQLRGGSELINKDTLTTQFAQCFRMAEIGILNMKTIPGFSTNTEDGKIDDDIQAKIDNELRQAAIETFITELPPSPKRKVA